MPEKFAGRRATQFNRALLADSEKCQGEIAQSVHDTLCQTLGGASLMMRVLANNFQGEDPTANAQLNELADMLDRAVDEACQVFKHLQPVTPGQDGLITALARLASETSIRVPCHFECENAVLVGDPVTAITIYRIAAEAVKNAVLHSEAKQITISIAKNRGSVLLKVNDDGRGFVPVPTTEAIHGLEMMRLRAQTVAGSLKIKSHPGQGTVVTLAIRNAGWSGKGLQKTTALEG